MRIQNIPLDRLYPHPDNPRKNLGDLSELSNSIKAQGVLQNLTVVPANIEKYQREVGGKKAYTGDYKIIIGHRRHAAANMAGRSDVPCEITVDMDEKTQIATMMLENMQRNQLTLIEEAQGFQLLLDLGSSFNDISAMTGMSETTVRRRVKIIKTFGAEAIERVQGRPITFDDYEQLYKIKDPDTQAKLLEKIGTVNWAWEIKGALSHQASETIKAEMIKVIAGIAIKVTQDEMRRAPKRNTLSFYNFSDKEFEEICSFAKEIRDGVGSYAGVDVFYSVGDRYGGIVIYTLEDAAVDVAEKNKAAAKKAEMAEKYEHMKGLFKQAYEMRVSFVKKINPTAENRDIVKFFAAEILMCGYRTCEDVYCDIFDIKGGLRPHWSDSKKETQVEAASRILGENCNTSNVYAFLLKSAYVNIEDPDASCVNMNLKHYQNNLLEKTYKWIAKLGYVMSDEEKALVYGTHPLYVKDGEPDQ